MVKVSHEDYIISHERGCKRIAVTIVQIALSISSCHYLVAVQLFLPNCTLVHVIAYTRTDYRITLSAFFLSNRKLLFAFL